MPHCIRMYGRLEPFLNNRVYHVFNKIIDKRRVFENEHCCQKFYDTAIYYRSNQAKVRFSDLSRLNKDVVNPILELVMLKCYFKVEILAYCIMPTHFHFILKQKVENGISKFISDTLNSFTRFFNILNSRKGPIFLPKFKSTMITRDEELIHVSRYVHLNPTTSDIVEINNLIFYPWSSYPAYATDKEDTLVDNNDILELFNFDKERYKKFVESNAEHQKTLEYIKRLDK